jgi:hypothetical protein
VDEPLSSDRSVAGEHFAATLAQPVVVNGLVVARRGQTVEGRVSEAVKAGKSKGVSRLGVELIELTLVDGQQLPVQTHLVEYSGGTSVGRDAAAVGTTTATGAAIGAAAAGGAGAGLGAIAGAAAAAIGVLTTRGRATVIYPESIVTFRMTQALTVSTGQSAMAFQPVSQEDYEPKMQRRAPSLRAGPSAYWYSYPPVFWGPGFVYHWGPRYYRGAWRRW